MTSCAVHTEHTDPPKREAGEPRPVLDGPRRDTLHRRARWLAWITIGYNAAEGVVAVLAGLAAPSAALVGFGLDSGVEVLSATALAWQFGGGANPAVRERRTLRLIAVSFYALAAYVGFDALRGLVGGAEAQPSTVGIVLAATSVVAMPALIWAKRRVGRELGSETVLADATQTLLCLSLSVALLIGLVLNAALGWAWADPLVALAIVVVALREGTEAWRGEPTCTC